MLIVKEISRQHKSTIFLQQKLKNEVVIYKREEIPYLNTYYWDGKDHM